MSHKFRWHSACIAAICIALSSGLAQISVAANVLYNPGFEEGVTECVGVSQGGGYGWSYVMTGSNSFRPESYYATVGPFSPEYHSGSQAIRFRTDGNGVGFCYQDVPVLPDSSYQASVWIRTYNDGSGFGATAGDVAGIWLQQLDSSGNVIEDDGEVVISKANSAYELLTVPAVQTTQSTAKIRYMLHCAIGADYTHGAISFDDCVLDGPAVSATVTGTVTDVETGAPIEGATIAVGGNSAQTNANGEYSVPVTPTSSRIMITASKNGYCSEQKYRVIDGDTSIVDFSIAPSPQTNFLANPGFESGAPDLWMGSNGYLGSGYGWKCKINGGTTAYIQGETAFASRMCFHCGNQAITMEPGGNNEMLIYQSINVLPNSVYKASAWIRGVDRQNDQTGFGYNGDTAGVRIIQYDADNNVLESSEPQESTISTATDDYQYAYFTFKSEPNAAKVDFVLFGQLYNDYTKCNVIFDDCVFTGPAADVTVKGTVTDNVTGAPIQDATVAIDGVSAQTNSSGAYIISSLPLEFANGLNKVTVSKSEYISENKYREFIGGTNIVDFSIVALPANNLIVNPGFEQGLPSSMYWVGSGGTITSGCDGWTFKFDGSTGYVQGAGDFRANERQYHSGNQALAPQPGDPGSEIFAYQLVRVLPNTEYKASIWVKGYDRNGDQTGFGYNSDDRAGLQIIQCDANGNPLADVPVAETYITESMQDYEYLPIAFTTVSTAAKVMFVLDGRFGFGSSSGMVMFDDCVLDGPAPSINKITGVVTSNGIPVEGATVKLISQDATAITDQDGRYVIDNLNIYDSPTIRVSKKNYYAQRRTLTNWMPGTVTADFDIVQVGSNQLVEAGFDDGWGSGWYSTKVSNGNVVPESNTSRWGATYYVSGVEAASIQASYGNGGGEIAQKVTVLPNTSYTARVKVRVDSENMEGVWGDTSDAQVAALFAREYDATGQLIDGKVHTAYAVETRDWETLEFSFVTDEKTRTVELGGSAFLVDDYNSSLARAIFDNFELNGPSAYSSAASIADLKSMNEGSSVLISGKVVTAAFDGFFYMEESDRFAGIRVNGSANVGDIVDVRGTLKNAGGEMVIDSDKIDAVPGGTVPAPLGMCNRFAQISGQLSPVGLYITAWGRVQAGATEGTFSISDGSNNDLTVYGTANSGDYVKVIGALGAEMQGNVVIPVLHAVSVTKAD